MVSNNSKLSLKALPLLPKSFSRDNSKTSSFPGEKILSSPVCSKAILLARLMQGKEPEM
jgi:hypothetical protein